MIKFFIAHYYYIVISALCIFIFNAWLRDPIIGSIFGMSKEQSVTDVVAYSKYNSYRNFFVYIGYLTYILCLVISVAIFFLDRENTLNRIVVVLATIVSAFMCVLMVLHFFNETPLL